MDREAPDLPSGRPMNSPKKGRRVGGPQARDAALYRRYPTLQLRRVGDSRSAGVDGEGGLPRPADLNCSSPRILTGRARARAICRECLLRRECVTYALPDPNLHGA